jgi:propanol-preferring alcohol dehydrogenase
MRAMVFEKVGVPLLSVDRPDPTPGPSDVLIKVHACGVCRTDLHIIDGELSRPKVPLVPGHEIVGEILAVGNRVDSLSVGQRIGIPWLGHTCGVCRYCIAGMENLCDEARFTGYQFDGGYADRAIADHRFCFPIPSGFTNEQAAPLLCAGLIGHRALRMAGDAKMIGLYGFGAAAHIIAQVACHEGRKVFAFTRAGDNAAQALAKELGAAWAGSSEEDPPEALDAAILFAPVGSLVPRALKAVRKGGVVVCAGIHMSDIPAFSYDLLWGERVVRSVANLTRRDGVDFFSAIKNTPLVIHTQSFPLRDANIALERLRQGKIQGAAVLIP